MSDSRDENGVGAINAIRTACVDCIFAKYVPYVAGQENDYGDGVKIEKTQVGCELNRIEKYKVQGVVEEVYDGTREFFVVNRFCQACRNENWAKEHHRDKWVEQVYKETELKTDVYVILSQDQNFDELSLTLESVANQTLKPASVCVINNYRGSRPSKVDRLLKDIVQSKGIPYRFKTIVETDLQDNPVLDDRAIDISVKDCNTFYAAVFQAGFSVPSHFLAHLDKLVNVELERFCLLILLPRANNFVVQSKLFKLVGGNKEVSLPEENLLLEGIEKKIKFFADYEGTQSMIQEINECTLELLR